MSASLTIEQRQQILKSASRYFCTSENWLRKSQFLSTTPLSPVSYQTKNLAFWKSKCVFLKNNESFTLSIEDLYQELDNGRIERALRYDFRKTGDTTEIFRFDNHGRRLNSLEPCHCHPGLGNDIRVLEGDPRMGGFSMISLTLCDVLILIDNYLQIGVLPWR